MNCVIPGVNVKVLSKTIQALSKIGDELQLEPRKDYLIFKAANMTTTAYCIFKFLDTFFSSYEIEDPEKVDDLSCVIPMKAILGVFKSHGHKDKKPEICKIELNDDNKIIFKFKYKHDVVVVRSLFLNDGQIVNINYNTLTSNQVSANAHLFSQVLTNFQAGDDDIGIEVYANKALMRNYIAGDINKSKGIRSQLTLTTGEFNSFQIGQETNITFSLKPFRAAIHFAESSNLGVCLNFETSGKPVILVIRNPTFEVNVVIATLNTDHISQSSLSTSIMLKTKSKAKHNMTIQDQQALESVNWDNDFDLQGENGFDNRKSQTDKNKSNTNLTINNNIPSINNALIDERPNLGNDENKDTDMVPGSPESPRSKRIKTIFGRCYETTFHSTMMDLGNVLAPDSDPELDDNF
ncbi:hypothetical protein ILUMI_01320 [Ignelater luminosus]|uniref:Cell cycle checkpoint control protein RAD9A n=1 Tax=Ignelater luminosus TaxID=2038154 RepID=A0A8K0DIQ7_IGNLU|nr:hypothetical protein ILUMI_01320 [Ignelater luminosus]